MERNHVTVTYFINSNNEAFPFRKESKLKKVLEQFAVFLAALYRILFGRTMTISFLAKISY